MKNKQNKTTSTGLKNIGRRLLAHPVYLWVSAVCAVLYVASTLYTPKLTGQAVDLIVGKGQVDFDGIVSLLAVFAAVIAVSSVFQWILTVCTGKMAFLVARDLRVEAFNKLQDLPVGYIDSHSRGDIMNRIVSDTEQIESGLAMSIGGLVTGVLTVVSIIVILFIESITVAIVVLVTVRCGVYFEKELLLFQGTVEDPR